MFSISSAPPLIKFLGGVFLNGAPVRFAPLITKTLAMIALNANEFVSMYDIWDELWGDEKPKSAETTLHTYVYLMRKKLQGFTVKNNNRAYALLIEPEEVDALRFMRVADQVYAAQRDAQVRVVMERARYAMGIVGNADLLPGADLGAPLGMWQTRISTHVRTVTLAWADAALLADLPSDALVQLMTIWLGAPFEEDSAFRLMPALCSLMRRREALEVYEKTARALWKEQGLKPQLRLRKLQEAILEGEDRDALIRSYLPLAICSLLASR